MRKIFNLVFLFVLIFGTLYVVNAYELKNQDSQRVMTLSTEVKVPYLPVVDVFNTDSEDITFINCKAEPLKTDNSATTETSWPAKDNEEIRVYFANQEIKFTLPVLIKEDRTFCQLQELVESIGGTCEWNQTSQTALAKKNDNIVEITVGSKGLKINDRLLSMDAKPFIEQENIYIPIQYICEGLGYEVEWNQEASSVNLSLKSQLKIDSTELDKIINTYCSTVSVYYENIETGYTYCYNVNKLYFSASVIKAPYSLFIYQLAEENAADLNSIHTYTSDDYRGGTGIIKTMKVGSRFTEQDLLKYAIQKSDNIAFGMLIKKYGISNFKDFITNMGGNADNIKTVTSANMTAQEAGLYIREIYKYIQSDGNYSNQFKQDLMSTTNPIIISDFPIARKYGWANKSFHDMAIVYSDSPYILVIMSELEDGTSSDFEIFKDISLKIQDFNKKNFSIEE